MPEVAVRPNSMCTPQPSSNVAPVFRADDFETFYERGHKLGSGQFAEVHECRCRATGRTFAAKAIRKRLFTTSRRGVRKQDIEREILQEVGGHDNIIALHDMFETQKEVVLVLELVSGGELFEHIVHKEFVPEREAALFIRQILCGLQFLHERHIAHLDIKPENILLVVSHESRVKLIDFGLSRRLGPADVPQRDMVGTPEFVAPEIVNYEPLGVATDMWALGVVTYILLSGASPFLGTSRAETFCNISAGRYHFDEEYFSRTTEMAKDFIRRLLVCNPRRRTTAADCLRHPWITGATMSRPMVLSSDECASDLLPSGEVCESSDGALESDQATVNTGAMRANRIRRRWKAACHAVVVCNRLCARVRRRLLAGHELQHKQPEPPGEQIGQQQQRVDSGRRRHRARYDPHNVVLSALLASAESGDTNGVQQLAAALSPRSLDTNMANELGETAAHVAAGAGQVDMMGWLVVHGGRIDQADRHGDTPLHWASRHGHSRVVAWLCGEGVIVDARNRCGETPLHLASRYGHQHCVDQLCANGADVDAQDQHGETAAHVAAWHGYALVMDSLCAAAPQLQLQNKDEETALHCAAARGHIECVQSLLEAGEVHDGEQSIDLQDRNGRTPLHLALQRNHLDAGLLLMSKGCRLDVQDSHGDTPLHIACRLGQLSAVQTLCHLGAPVDVLNAATLAPLHVAAREGHVEIVRCLCLAGAKIDIKNKDGLTPEIMALAQDCSAVGALLNRLKPESVRASLVEQLCSTDAPLRRIKLKVFGASGAGKSRLIGSLQTGVIGGLLVPVPDIVKSPGRWKMAFYRVWDCPQGGLSRRFSESSNGRHSGASEQHEGGHSSNESVGSAAHSSRLHSPIQEENAAENNNTWEKVYDHFVGNTDCVHLVVFRAGEPTETQYANVLYWMNFLTGRVTATEPIGHMGVSARRAPVILVATNAEEQSANGNGGGGEADAMLSTVRLRFGSDFDIYEKIVYVDTGSPNAQGMRLLRQCLAKARTDVLARLPRQMALVDTASQYLAQERRKAPLCGLPAIGWPDFMQRIRADVNPLAGEPHCRQVVQQLQLIGDVVYLKNDAQELDLVVLSPEWLGAHVIGTLLSAEFMSRARITGCYTADDLAPLCPVDAGAGAADQLLSVLHTLQMCAPLDEYEHEFAAFNMVDWPRDAWQPLQSNVGVAVPPQTVYGGVRVQAARGMERQFEPLWPRVQTALRQSMQDFHDPLDAELHQWRGCSKMCSGRMEAFLRLLASRNDGVEIVVRGPADHAASCFYFLEDLANLVEQTCADVAPGLPLERHFLSPVDLRMHAPRPAVYPPAAVMHMQRKEGVTVKSAGGDQEEPFTSVVCFGSVDVAGQLTLGLDVSVAHMPLAGRRELATLLDSADSMGRDWSILAVKLNLTEHVPDVDSTGQQLSRTDQLLAEWAAAAPHAATVGALCDVLEELGRQDALQAIYRTVPLYVLSSSDDSSTALAGSGATGNGDDQPHRQGGGGGGGSDATNSSELIPPSEGAGGQRGEGAQAHGEAVDGHNRAGMVNSGAGSASQWSQVEGSSASGSGDSGVASSSTTSAASAASHRSNSTMSR